MPLSHQTYLYLDTRRDVQSMESEAGELAAVGLKVGRLSLTRSETLLGDGRAKVPPLLLPPELPEARRPGRRRRPRARTRRAPSAPAAPHQPDPPCVAAASAAARRTECRDHPGPAERASSWLRPPWPPLEPASSPRPSSFASSFYPPKRLTGGAGTRLSHSVNLWRKYYHNMIERYHVH